MHRDLVNNMTTIASAHSLLDRQLHDFLEYLPALRDATPDSVHDARVATRRLRETLRYFANSHQRQAERMTKAIRKTGRRLGEVRDLDVMDTLLERQAQRSPGAVHAVSLARLGVAERQHAARRRMVKALERLELERLSGTLPQGSIWTRCLGHVLPSGWTAFLRGRIGEQAARLRRAVDHAGGVYFPKRAHDVRISAKKLRYSVELAQVTAVWKPRHLIGDLRDVQDTLGNLHDAQVLLHELDGLVAEGAAAAGEIALLQQGLKGDIAERHTEYLAQRDRLSAICAACDRFAGISSDGPRRWSAVARPLVTASAMAVPAGLLLLEYQRRRIDTTPGLGGSLTRPPGQLLPLGGRSAAVRMP